MATAQAGAVFGAAAAGDGGAKMAVHAGFVAQDGRRAPEGVVYASNEDLGGELFVASPVEGMPQVAPRREVVTLLQPGTGDDEAQFGSIGVMLDVVHFQTNQVFPFAPVPLGAGAFKQVFVVGDGVGGDRFFRMNEEECWDGGSIHQFATCLCCDGRCFGGEPASGPSAQC